MLLRCFCLELGVSRLCCRGGGSAPARKGEREGRGSWAVEGGEGMRLAAAAAPAACCCTCCCAGGEPTGSCCCTRRRLAGWLTAVPSWLSPPPPASSVCLLRPDTVGVF